MTGILMTRIAVPLEHGPRHLSVMKGSVVSTEKERAGDDYEVLAMWKRKYKDLPPCRLIV
jgi:hypothetical protein